jgi:hypothetical protein
MVLSTNVKLNKEHYSMNYMFVGQLALVVDILIYPLIDRLDYIVLYVVEYLFHM